MFRNSRIIISLIFFCTVWFSCNADVKLQHIIDHVNNATTHWTVSSPIIVFENLSIISSTKLLKNVLNELEII